MSTEASKALLNHWLELWQGKLSLADEIVGPGFVAHFPPTTTQLNEIHGTEALKAWISRTLALFLEVELRLELTPVAEADKIVGRWIFRAIYQGGIPGANSKAGTSIAFKGIDILRIADGKIVEYWVSSDGLYLMQQLGVIPSA